jgi:hypothetical protein
MCGVVHIIYIGFSRLHIVLAWHFLPLSSAFFYSVANKLDLIIILMVLSRKWSGTTFTILTITTFHSFETSYSAFISFPCSLSSMYCLNDTCWVFTLEFYRMLHSSCFIVTFFILGSHLFYSVVTKSSSSPLFVSQIKSKIGNILTKTVVLRVNLILDWSPIISRTP